MLLQLGDIVFEKAFGPDVINRADETTYAEHALISQKPRLQPTANNLEEIELPIRLRAEWCNVADTVLKLKKSKDEFEVLPLLMGTGRYLGDYVIIKTDEAQTVTLDDGFAVEAQINISLKEYAIPDKLQQRQNAERKQAFAVGEKRPVRSLTSQKNTNPQLVVKDLSGAYSNTAAAGTLVGEYTNNTSAQPLISQKIESALKQAKEKLVSAETTLNTLAIPANKTDLLNKITLLKNAIGQFVFPVSSSTVLNADYLNLTNKIKDLKTAAASLVNMVATRVA